MRALLLLLALATGAHAGECLPEALECPRGMAQGIFSARPTATNRRAGLLYAVTDCATNACNAGGGSIKCLQRVRTDGTSWDVVTCDGTGNVGAPTTAGYWTAAADGQLSDERSLAGLTALVVSTAGTPSAYGGSSCPAGQVPNAISGLGVLGGCVDVATQAEFDAHLHDSRYYTQAQLATSDGDAPNAGSNRMHWNNLVGVPAGFADGTDDGAGGGTSGTGTTEPTWTIDDDNTGGTEPANQAGVCIEGGTGDVCLRWSASPRRIVLSGPTGASVALPDPGDGARGSVLLDNATTCPDPGTGATTFCSVAGVLTQREPGGALVKLLTQSGGDYGGFTCAAGACALDANSVTPDMAVAGGQTDEACLTYEATGDTWEWQSCGGGGGVGTIADEGTTLNQRSTVNFAGNGVACGDNAGLSRTDCTITGNVDGGAAGAGTTRPATGQVFQVRSHATDCKSLTDGAYRELCMDESTGRLWYCPRASGCTNSAHWQRLPGWTRTEVTVPLARCVAGSATATVDLPTSGGPTPVCVSGATKGALQYADGVTSEAYITGVLPDNWVPSAAACTGTGAPHRCCTAAGTGANCPITTFRYWWRSPDATSGDVQMELAVKCIPDNGTDASDTGFNAVASRTDTWQGTNTLHQSPSSSGGVNMTGCAPGNTFRAYLRRNGATGGDSLTGGSALAQVERLQLIYQVENTL